MEIHLDNGPLEGRHYETGTLRNAWAVAGAGGAAHGPAVFRGAAAGGEWRDHLWLFHVRLWRRAAAPGAADAQHV